MLASTQDKTIQDKTISFNRVFRNQDVYFGKHVFLRMSQFDIVNMSKMPGYNRTSCVNTSAQMANILRITNFKFANIMHVRIHEQVRKHVFIDVCLHSIYITLFICVYLHSI